jgi:hypothetical protein
MGLGWTFKTQTIARLHSIITTVLGNQDHFFPVRFESWCLSGFSDSPRPQRISSLWISPDFPTARAVTVQGQAWKTWISNPPGICVLWTSTTDDKTFSTLFGRGQAQQWHLGQVALVDTHKGPRWSGAAPPAPHPASTTDSGKDRSLLLLNTCPHRQNTKALFFDPLCTAEKA